jgi:hypothetical protein
LYLDERYRCKASAQWALSLESFGSMSFVVGKLVPRDALFGKRTSYCFLSEKRIDQCFFWKADLGLNLEFGAYRGLTIHLVGGCSTTARLQLDYTSHPNVTLLRLLSGAQRGPTITFWLNSGKVSPQLLASELTFSAGFRYPTVRIRSGHWTDITPH